VNILITGASGFLGSALALHLLDTGQQVALLLRSSSNIERLRGRQSEFDLGRCDADTEIDAFICRTQPDVIIHTACAYGRVGETLLQINDANLRYGLVIIESLIRTKKPATFINTGTILDAAISPYALTKQQFLQTGRFLAAQSSGQLRFINILLQHMYGPGDSPSKFTSHVLNSCFQNQPILKLTAGEQKRDFIYIDDVVSAYTTVIEQRDKFEITAEVEVGSGNAPTIREFVETVHKVAASRTQLLFGEIPYRANEPMHCQANINKLKAMGWQPRYDLESGLKKTFELEFNK
jgi:nucleoside-diphosphate-sugar epimerase